MTSSAETKAFAFDTSGVVEGPINTPDGLRFDAIGWGFLDAFTQGYVEALFNETLFNTRDDDLRKVGFSDLAPETLARIMVDCAYGQRAIASGDIGVRGETDAERGAWFWIERQRRWRELPPLAPYLGDDGLIYVREA